METQQNSDHGLKRQLRLRDLVFSQILVVVGSSWVGMAAGLGRAQAVVWIAAMVLFYLPMAVSVYYLNREIPMEGGLYVWARRAFGDSGGFMTAFNIWAYALCSTATILFQIPSEASYMLGPSAAWLPENHIAVLCLMFVFVALLAASAYRGLELGKWIHNISGIAMLFVFGLLIVSPAWAWLHHVPLQYAALSMHLPRANMVSLALMGQMFGALCGLEYIAIMAGEARSPQRDIGRSVIIATPLVAIMFIFGTGAVVAFHEMNSTEAINYVAPIPQTLRYAFGNAGVASYVAGGAILLLQIRILGAASLLFTGVTRLPMAAGWDRLIPGWFSRLHPKYKTPVNSIWFCSAIVLALLLCSSLGVRAAEAFEVLNNAASELYSLAYFAMFAIPLVGAVTLRRRLPLWVSITSAVGFLSTLFTFVLTAYPFVDVVNPKLYAAKILGTTVVANTLGYLFYRSRNAKLSIRQNGSTTA